MLKFASSEFTVVSPADFIRDTYGNVKIAGDMELKYGEILKDPLSHYVWSHSTIIASVDVEPDCDHKIRPECHPFVNKNADAWERRLLAKTFKTFVGKPNYVNHVQVPELAVGNVIDAVAIQHPDSVYTHILVATHRQHSIANRIIDGSIHAMSMGADVAFTICTKCGKIARDAADLCEHIRYERGRGYRDNNGIVRIIAELCGHHTKPESNTFIEASWVEDPAFLCAQTHATVFMPSDVFTEESQLPEVIATPSSLEVIAETMPAEGQLKAASVQKEAYKGEELDAPKMKQDTPDEGWATLDIQEYAAPPSENYAWTDAPNVMADASKNWKEDKVILPGEIANLLTAVDVPVKAKDIEEYLAKVASEVGTKDPHVFIAALEEALGRALTIEEKVAALESVALGELA